MVLFRIVGDQFSPFGWSLYHFLWQGMLVASVYSLACLIWGRNARHRYALACFFLGVVLVLPIWQVWMIFNRHHGIALGVGPPERLLPWMTWIALVWLFVAGAISLRTLLAADTLTTLWLSQASEDVSLNKKAHEVANQLGLKTPAVVRSEAADVMAVIGGLRPIIVVPTSLPDCLDDAQFRALLAHEIAHVSRLDPLVNFVLSTLESLVFFSSCGGMVGGRGACLPRVLLRRCRYQVFARCSRVRSRADDACEDAWLENQGRTFRERRRSQSTRRAISFGQKRIEAILLGRKRLSFLDG